MIVKSAIVRELGAERLLLPALLDDAFAAEEQANYYVALLRQAHAHADAPGDDLGNGLHGKRLAAHIEDDVLDRVVAGSVRLDDRHYHIPHGGDITAALVRAVEAMIRPLSGDEAELFRRRLDDLAQPPAHDDVLERAEIKRLAAADRTTGDSLHLLAADVRKALGRLQQEITTETVGGARAFTLRPADRPLVEAFMAGVARTAPLAFGRPGLVTTATVANGRLMIENDIGNTDAHVLVVTIDGLAARVIYTDVHRSRLAFFRRLLSGLALRWSPAEEWRAERCADTGYALGVGLFEAVGQRELCRFLQDLGSRLVFLIDWNRARKQLRGFAGKAEALALLDWAAAEGLGHLGFLALGGERAIFQAMEVAAAGRLRFGDRLIDVIGRERTAAFLRFALETASRGLLAGRSAAAIEDDLQTELSACFGTGQEGLLMLACQQADRLQEIARAAGTCVDAQSAACEAAPRGSREQLADALERAAGTLASTARLLRGEGADGKADEEGAEQGDAPLRLRRG